MIRILAALAAVVFGTATALAQSSPGLRAGQIPTAAQWNSYFAAKQDVLGFVPVNRAGDAMAGKLTIVAPNTGGAGMNLNCGTSPASPAEGDFWCTSAGLFLRSGGVTYGPFAAGSVASVGLALPGSVFSVSGSPVTGTGTLTGAFQNQSQGTVFAGPSSGAPGAPSFRALVDTDLPSVNAIIDASQLPYPNYTDIGGVRAAAAVASQWIDSISVFGVPHTSQPAFSDLSGTIVTAQIANSAVTFAKGGVQPGGWVNYTPTVACSGGGAITATADGWYQQAAPKTYIVTIQYKASAASCGSAQDLSVPTGVVANHSGIRWIFAGVNGTSGNPVNVAAFAGASIIRFSVPGASTDQYYATGTFEIQ